MGSIVIVIVSALVIGGLIWMRRRRRHAYATPSTPEVIPRETIAQKAFAHGNSCLAAGQFAEAIAAFHQVRELSPKHPYVASRLAEVERQQHATSTTLPVQAAV